MIEFRPFLVEKVKDLLPEQPIILNFNLLISFTDNGNKELKQNEVQNKEVAVEIEESR